jgi:hypothetical protein
MFTILTFDNCLFAGLVPLVEVNAGVCPRQDDAEAEGDAAAAEGDIVEAAVVEHLVRGQELRQKAAAESAEEYGRPCVARHFFVVLLWNLKLENSMSLYSRGRLM